MDRWLNIGTEPENQIIETRIDDKLGIRNEQLLKRIGNLWFVPDGSMYVYYAPTHWRPSKENLYVRS